MSRRAPKAPSAPHALTLFDTSAQKATRRAAQASAPHVDDEMLTELERIRTYYRAMDTETTGTRETDEVAEIAAVRIFDGSVSFHSHVRPTVPFHPEVIDPKGKVCFDPAACKTAPYWREVEQHMARASRMPLISWSNPGYEDDEGNWHAGGNFDRRLIEQSRRALGLPELLPHQWAIANLKPIYAAFRGVAVSSSLTLEEACNREWVAFRGRPHTALADAYACVDLIWACVEDGYFRQTDLESYVRDMELSREMAGRGIPPCHPAWLARASAFERRGYVSEAKACREYAKEIEDAHA